MENNISAQQEFLVALSLFEPDFNLGSPKYNGYNINELTLFKNKLEELYLNYEREITVNFQSELGELFLKNVLKKLHDIYYTLKSIYPYDLTNSFYDSDLYSDTDILHKLKEFLSTQLDFTNKAFNEAASNLELLPGSMASLESPSAGKDFTSVSIQIKKHTSDLSLINLAVFWTLAAECRFINLKSRKELIDFISNNFKFRKGEEYVDINPNNLKTLISKLYNPDYQSEASLPGSQEDIVKSMMEVLEDFKNGTLKELSTPGINNSNSRFASK